MNFFIAQIISSNILLFIVSSLFLYLSFNYKNKFFKNLDVQISTLANDLQNEKAKNIFDKLTIFGNAIFHISFSIVLAIVLFINHEKYTAVSVLFILIFSWGFNRLLKLIFRRERPEEIVKTVKKRLSFSYPSGHVMASIPIYFFSAMILQSKIDFLPWYFIAFIILSAVISTRLYLSHHFFTDVLGGICMGVVSYRVGILFYVTIMRMI